MPGMDGKTCDRRSSRESSAELNNSEAETCLDLDHKNDISRQGEYSKDFLFFCQPLPAPIPWKTGIIWPTVGRIGILFALPQRAWG